MSAHFSNTDILIADMGMWTRDLPHCLLQLQSLRCLVVILTRSTRKKFLKVYLNKLLIQINTIIFKSITILSQSLVKSALIESKLLCKRYFARTQFWLGPCSWEADCNWTGSCPSLLRMGKKISLRIKKAAAFFKQRSHNFLHRKGRGNIYKWLIIYFKRQ